jgi:Zn-dependent membrane protease YugP
LLFTSADASTITTAGVVIDTLSATALCHLFAYCLPFVYVCLCVLALDYQTITLTVDFPWCRMQARDQLTASDVVNTQTGKSEKSEVGDAAAAAAAAGSN